MSAPAGWQRHRAPALFLAVVLFVLAVNFAMGTPFTLRLLVEALGYGLIGLGLNIQFGYGGLFNFGVMGFVMPGGFASVFVSMPVNTQFWASEGPFLLAKALAALAAGAALVAVGRRLAPRNFWGQALVVLLWFLAYILYRSQIDPAAAYIETNSGWVGGLGLNPVLGWIFGGLLAGLVAFGVGRVALGLRSDYLAIATIGIGEILRALIKNMDWLTRGTKTVSPVPWATPLPQDWQAWGLSITDSFVAARAGFLALGLAMLALVFFLVERAYRGPWGRMMRAIRDNHVAAASMGKNVTARQIEIFVLGAVPMGIGGAMLVSFSQILDPGGYRTINATFLIWVAVILGGAGNNFGVLLASVVLYAVFVLSDPVAQFFLLNLSGWSENMGWGAIPEIDSRALQMRVFVIGLAIWLTLRFAPKGLLPETPRTAMK